jgi:hypothetical protein
LVLHIFALWVLKTDRGEIVEVRLRPDQAALPC